MEERSGWMMEWEIAEAKIGMVADRIIREVFGGRETIGGYE